VSGVFAYSKTKGLFAGVSLEGKVIIERRDANEKIYGQSVKAAQILRGAVPVPPAADPLMQVLNSRIFSGVGGSYTAGDAMYNDIPVYDESNDDVVWQGRSGSAFGEGVRSDRTGSQAASPSTPTGDYQYRDATGSGPNRASTWADDVYDQPYGSRTNQNETFDQMSSTNRSNTFGSDYTYTDRATKPAPARPTAPKPSFSTQGKAGLGPNQAIAKFTFEADQPGDLGFKKGDIITVLKKTEKETDWWTGRIGTREGIFPRYENNCVNLCTY